MTTRVCDSCGTLLECTHDPERQQFVRELAASRPLEDGEYRFWITYCRDCLRRVLHRERVAA